MNSPNEESAMESGTGFMNLHHITGRTRQIISIVLQAIAGYLVGGVVAKGLAQWVHATFKDCECPLEHPYTAVGIGLSTGASVGTALGVMLSGLLLLYLFNQRRRMWIPVLLMIVVVVFEHALFLVLAILGDDVVDFQPDLLLFALLRALIASLVFTLIGDPLRNLEDPKREAE